MSSYVLKPKVDVVIVERKTRGKFPGEKATKGTVGLVWSRWTSNSVYGTEKISLLSKEARVLFTTSRCVSKVGTIVDFPDLVDAYKEYAELEFVPVFGFVKKSSIEDLLSNKPEFLLIKFLSRETAQAVPTSCIHFEDLDEIVNSKEKEKFFCMRIETWLLKRSGLL